MSLYLIKSQEIMAELGKICSTKADATKAFRIILQAVEHPSNAHLLAVYAEAYKNWLLAGLPQLDSGLELREIAQEGPSIWQAVMWAIERKQGRLPMDYLIWLAEKKL